jgi:hypothetical protein
MHIEKRTQGNIVLCTSMLNSDITSHQGNTKLVSPPANELPDGYLTCGGNAIYVFAYFISYFVSINIVRRG